MNDLYDELKEKNFTAQSARKRVGGKHRYMFPSDKLSYSELKKLNGEITVYTMKEPISWVKFKSYPKDIQKEYIQWFVDEFGISRGLFSKMLGITLPGSYPYMKAQGQIEMFVSQMTMENTLRFNEWLKQFEPETAEEQPAPPEEPKKEKVKVVEQPVYFNTIASCEMNMEGKASEIAQTLFALFKDQKIAVNIVYGGVSEE